MIISYSYILSFLFLYIPALVAGSEPPQGSLPPKGDQEVIPVHSKSNQPTYLSLAHMNLPELDPDIKMYLEMEIQTIDPEIDRLFEARDLKFKKDFGRLLGVYTGLYTEVETAVSDFAFVKGYIGSNILKYYLSKSKHGDHFLNLAENCSVYMQSFIGHNPFGCTVFTVHNSTFFKNLEPEIFFREVSSGQCSTFDKEFYFNYVNYLIFCEIKSMRMQGLSLIFGNRLLDQDDKLIVDLTLIETILDELISEHEKKAVKLLKYPGILKDNDVAALFKKRADDILDSIANGGANKPKISPEPFRPLDSPTKFQVHEAHVPAHERQPEDSHTEVSQIPPKTDVRNSESHEGSIHSVLPGQPHPHVKDKQQLRPASLPPKFLDSPGSIQEVSEGPPGSEGQKFYTSASFFESSSVVQKRSNGSVSSSISLSSFKPKDIRPQRTKETNPKPVQTDGTERPTPSENDSNAGGRGKLFYIFAFLFGALILIGFSLIAYHLLLRNKKQAALISA